MLYTEFTTPLALKLVGLCQYDQLKSKQNQQQLTTIGSRNQKGRAIRSSENQTDGAGSRTLILLMSPLLTIK